MEYYNNMSVNIENDDYFQMMMNNAWNLTGNSLTYQNLGKGWTNDDGSKKGSP